MSFILKNVVHAIVIAFLCINEYSEYAKINKGIAPVLIYTGALLGGWALGHIVGYFAG